MVWYMDGSKTEQGVGVGKAKILISLGKYATVFQAEVAAIQCCAKEIIRQGTVNQSIAIFFRQPSSVKGNQFQAGQLKTSMGLS